MRICLNLRKSSTVGLPNISPKKACIFEIDWKNKKTTLILEITVENIKNNKPFGIKDKIGYLLAEGDSIIGGCGDLPLELENLSKENFLAFRFIPIYLG